MSKTFKKRKYDKQKNPNSLVTIQHPTTKNGILIA